MTTHYIRYTKHKITNDLFPCELLFISTDEGLNIIEKCAQTLWRYLLYMYYKVKTHL